MLQKYSSPRELKLNTSLRTFLAKACISVGGKRMYVTVSMWLSTKCKL